MSEFMPQAHSSHRFFRFLLLTVFVAGILAAPLRLTAQESAQNSAPAVQSEPASATGEAAKPEAKDAEQAQTDAFRLEGPLVKWTAKTLHVSAETAAKSFEFFNFLIIVFGIGIPLFRWLPKFLRNRREKVRNDIELARKVTAEANARLGAIEAKLTGLDEEIAQIRVQVEQESKQDETRIKSTIQEESARIVASAEQEISASAAQARRSLRNFAADLAIDQAVKQLTFTPETDRALIAEFLGDAALTGTAKGGQK
jgi:F-type H+-transporting ATPase subunit b